MSDKNNADVSAQTVEDVAHETADNLLLDAFDAIPILVPTRPIHTSEAMLIHAHALIAKLDAMEASHLAAHREMMGVLERIASKLDGKTVPAPTADEGELIVATLKDAWLKHHPTHTEGEYIEAMRRIEMLAGL